jgi:hydrogenase small subunit
MEVSRRRFLKYCGLSAAAIGLDAVDLGLLRKAFANPVGPSVIWLKGSSCDGCSISFLNRISDDAPHNAAEVLTDNINLIYHTNIMAMAGESSVAAMRQAYEAGGYVLVIEGGVPTAFGGHACIAYSYNGVEVTFQQLVEELTARAAAIVCVGTCAAWGGIPASGSNPTAVVGIKDLTGRTTVNLSGCPVNPDWIVWAVVQLILGNPITLDEYGRPTALFRAQGFIHDSCPRNLGGGNEAAQFGEDGHCLINLGCRGPFTEAKCHNCWNGKAGQGHWCIGVNAPCQGCVEPTFPGSKSFFEPYNPA